MSKVLMLLLALGVGVSSPRIVANGVVREAESSGPCVTASDSTKGHLRAIEYFVTATDSTKLAAVGLPYRPLGGVTLVSDSTVCAQAVAAYNSSLLPQDSLGEVTRGVLLRLGTSTYSFSPQQGTRITNLFFFMNQQFQIIHQTLAI